MARDKISSREKSVALEWIEVGDRMREPDREVIAELDKSMAQDGLLQRIGLRERTDGRYTHPGPERSKAASKLGWRKIEAKVYRSDVADRILKIWGSSRTYAAKN